MSNHTTQKEEGQPAQGRQPGGGRRSGGSRNRNRNRNREGSGNGNRGGQGRSRGGGQGRSQGGQGRKPSRRPEPKPIPLTFWQKFLKALGLYDPGKRSSPSRVPKPAESSPSGGKPKRPAPKAARKESVRKRPAPSPDDVDTKRLYLGNLSFEVTEYELEDLLKGIGPVRSIELVYNRNTHKSKGYGFAEMATIEDAKRAVEVLHDQPFMGRNLIINGAKSKGPKDGEDSEQDQDQDQQEQEEEA
jgi:RNA recognition motif-containing protein